MKYPLPIRFCRFLFLLLALFGFGADGRAATFTVDRTDDVGVDTCTTAPNDCTLPGAIAKANTTTDADTINFDATVFAAPGPHVISLAKPLQLLFRNVTITGPGAGLLTVQEAGTNHLLDIFTVDYRVRATVSGLTISNASRGIYNYGGTLTATGCTVSGNSEGIANNGGPVTVTGCTMSGNAYYGFRNISGTVTATNCALSGNSSAGIFNDSYGTLTARDCTLSGNTEDGIVNYYGRLTATNCTVSGNGGGINTRGTATLKNTLVAGNATNIKGTFTDGGHNITSGTAADAGLDPAGLQDNGGPTKTIALIAGSPAIDAGNSTLTTDQRGAARPYDDPAVVNATGGNGSDIGAFELFIPTISINNARTFNEGSATMPGATTFAIMLSQPSVQTVSVNYHTLNGLNNPATAGSDYVAKNGRLTFAPGETLKRVTIFFMGDSVTELNETFFLDLETSTNAALSDYRGVGTIRNDDGPSLSISDALPTDEGKSSLTPQAFVVSLSAASTDTVTVAWTTAIGTAGPEDYIAASGTLTFAPGETSKLILVQLKGDTMVEPDEIYQVNLSKPTYALIADGQGLGTIRNDDSETLSFGTNEPSQ